METIVMITALEHSLVGVEQGASTNAGSSAPPSPRLTPAAARVRVWA